MSPRPHLSYGACKPAWLTSELLVSMGLSPYLWFLHAKQRLLDRITSLYRSQTSPVALCMQNSMISIRPTSLYGSLPSSAVFMFKRVHYGQELLVSLGPRLYLSICAYKTAWFAPEWQVYMGSSHHLWFCACKTASLGPDILVCMGPRPHQWSWALITVCLAQEQKGYIGSRPHLWFLHAKQRLLDQNNKSLRFPDMTCHFVHVQERA